MKKYYELDLSSNAKYPQVEQSIWNSDDHVIDVRSPLSIHGIESIPLSKPLVEGVTFPVFKMKNSSQLTDFISCAFLANDRGYIVSQRLKNLLLKYSTKNIAFYSISIQYKNELHEYYYMHVIHQEILKHFDFNQSSFNILEYDILSKEGVTFGSEEMLQHYSNSNISSEIRPDVLCFNITSVALEQILTIDTNSIANIFFSQEIIDDITKNKITGFEINYSWVVLDFEK